MQIDLGNFTDWRFSRLENLVCPQGLPGIIKSGHDVQFEIQQAGNIKTALFGGEGLFFATLHGPGKIWLQSLPFSRLAGRMLQASPERGGGKGEGSVLGSLGDFFDGD